MSKSPAKTRAERGQELRNIWAHICMYLDDAERLEAGVSEDRSMTINTLRAFDFLATASERKPGPDFFDSEEIELAIQDLKRWRFFSCKTSGCTTQEPKCDYCVRIFRVESMLYALRNRLARGRARVYAT